MADETKKTTKRKRRQRKPKASAIRYQRLFEAARDGIIILDAATRKITDVNPFMVELLGYSRDELLGKEIWEIGLLKDDEASRKTFQEMKEKGYVRYEDLPLQTKDGKQRDVELIGNVYAENGHQVIQCNLREISGRKYAEATVRETNDQLKVLVAELQERDIEMRLLNRMHDLLQACTTQEEAYKVIALVASDLFAGQNGCLAILHPWDRHLETVARWGDEQAVEPIFSLEDCWALRRGELHEVIDPKASLLCRHFVREPKAAYLCMPLTVQGETLGVLCLINESPGKNEHQVSQQQLALTVGEGIKMSLSNLKLREKLREEAIRDPLTGLFNRRFLEETLARDVYRALRRNSALCVAMLDLDDFKRFNDTFGHDAGDSLLRELGLLLREKLRKSDISCRYGGDEFVLVLPDSPLADTQRRVEEICGLVKEMQVRHSGPLLSTMTVSAGVAQVGIHGSSPGDLLRAADKALYLAKAAGRDRVVVYQAKEA